MRLVGGDVQSMSLSVINIWPDTGSTMAPSEENKADFAM